jgi:LPS export ABC transporter protein LptC
VELEGKRGEYDRRSGEMNLEGDLRGRTSNGYSIQTDQILYKHKEGFLETKMPVKIIGPSFSITGQGLYLDLTREVLRIPSHVITSIDEGSLTL